ncbi:META domain-containing protein [Stenoxybacter acetivorans]|uniref:META domain-containing protein n=1 Tax=Stenoxybacter acetivorans TaxID=422441 RepID=UPI000567C5D9|nr:META domain-containing protein [Stenoxybacter acetivorans]
MKKMITTALLLSALTVGASGCANSQSQANSTDTQSLSGKWQVVRIDNQAVSRDDYQVSFNAENKSVYAYFGCNRFRGAYTQQADKLQFSQLASTMMMCVNIEDENRAKAALTDTRQWRNLNQDGGLVQLLDGNAKVRLELKPTAE